MSYEDLFDLYFKIESAECNAEKVQDTLNTEKTDKPNGSAVAPGAPLKTPSLPATDKAPADPVNDKVATVDINECPNAIISVVDNVDNDTAAHRALDAVEYFAVAMDEAGVDNKAAKSQTSLGSMLDDNNSVASLCKHPSQNIWKLWYLCYDCTKAWPDMQHEIATVATVEDFRLVYNHIKPPTEIKLGCDYSFFKSNIRPMWEDAANVDGGRWVLFLHKGFADDLNKVWENVMLCLIGEEFDDMAEICGAVFGKRRKTHNISIWTSNGNNKDTILAIGHKMLQTLGLGQKHKVVLQYKLHKHSMAIHTL